MPARARRRRRRHRRAGGDAARARLPLRIDRAGLLDAHPSGRDSGLALEASDGREAAVEPLLKRIAGERIMLLSSGGSDWIARLRQGREGRGRLPHHRAQGLHLRRADRRSSDDRRRAGERGEPPMVLHFGIPMNSPHVKVLDTWRTLGMRGTGSHDVLIDGHVVPDAARRAEAQGRRMASAVPDHRHHRVSAHLLRLSRRGRKRARHRDRTGEEARRRASTRSISPAGWRRS